MPDSAFSKRFIRQSFFRSHVRSFHSKNILVGLRFWRYVADWCRLIRWFKIIRLFSFFRFHSSVFSLKAEWSLSNRFWHHDVWSCRDMEFNS
jgi:hypothetical protein